MLGVSLFIHALRQVFGNLGGALKVTGVLYVLQFAVLLLLGLSITRYPEVLWLVVLYGGLGWRVVMGLIVMVTTGIWMAIAWHRFALRAEVPKTVLPAFPGDGFGSYLGWSAILVVMSFFLTLVLGLAGVWATSRLVTVSLTAAVVAMVLIVKIPLATFLLCLSPVLPAAALREDLSIGGAWVRTRGGIPAIVVIAVLLVATEMAVGYLLGYLPRGRWTGHLVDFALGWVYWTVGISIISTIYGHFVEGRALRA